MSSLAHIQHLYAKGSGYRDGIYYSNRPVEPIPTDPFLDWTTYTLDHPYMDRVALVDAPSGESITYTELKHRVYAVASGLAGIGVKQGQVLMILSPNSIHFPVLVLAITAIGAVATTVNTANTTFEIVKQVKDSNTSVVITVPELLGVVAGLELPVILIDHKSVSPSDGPVAVGVIPIASLSQLYKADPSKAPKVQIRQTDTAVLLYSSGTTGLSKGVKLTHGNAIAAACISNDRTQDMNSQLTFATVIPVYHVYGLIVVVGTQLKRGAKLVILPKFEFAKFLAAVERYKVTHAPVVPPILIALVKSPLVENYDLTSLQQVGVGAAPCGREILTAFAERFKNVQIKQGFGMTETTAMGATTPPFADDAMAHFGAVGLLAANFEARIVDVESGKPLPPNQKGELWLRGPAVMQGYLNNETATSETLDKEGWLHTGDVGYFDDEGYLYIVDRLKELIKYNGFQVPPAELEAVLLVHPQILDVAVAGFPDEQTGQIPVAFVVRRQGSSLSEADVKDFVAKQVAPYKKVRKVIFVESIPKSGSGKILRRELKLLPMSKL